MAVTRSPRHADQTTAERGGGESGSAMKEACAKSGAMAKRWVGVGVATTGRCGSIKDTAKWHSTQWVQRAVPGSAGVAASWQGMAAVRDTATVEVSVLSARAIGITAAMAPDSGSHASISVTNNFRKKCILIRLAYRKKVHRICFARREANPV